MSIMPRTRSYHDQVLILRYSSEWRDRAQNGQSVRVGSSQTGAWLLPDTETQPLPHPGIKIKKIIYINNIILMHNNIKIKCNALYEDPDPSSAALLQPLPFPWAETCSGPQCSRVKVRGVGDSQLRQHRGPGARHVVAGPHAGQLDMGPPHGRHRGMSRMLQSTN